MKIGLGAKLTLLGAMLSTVPAAQAQNTLKVERGKVFNKVGVVITYNRSFSIGKGIGLVADTPVNRTGTLTLRLHFKASSTVKSPTWAIRIVEDNPMRRPLWSFSSLEENSDDFWSDELRSNAVRVEVYSTQESNTLNLSIDKIIIDGSHAAPQAITPPNDLEKWSAQTSPQRKLWGKSVARIRFVSDEDGEPYVCTGFAVSADLIMTNHHCVKTQREARSAHVDFDYDFDFATPETIRGKELVPGDPGLDFALIRLRKPVDTAIRKPLKLATDLPSQQLLLIGHPAGDPKHLSSKGCVIKKTNVAGLTKDLTDFEHGCDTLGGNSGSPIQDEAGNVVGLHHLGFWENDPNPDNPTLFNQAIRMSEIIKFIRENKPELKAALGIQ